MNEIANDILKFLAFSQKLKSQQRTIKLAKDRHDLKKKIDLLKSLKMVLIHDLVEAEIGDTPYGDSISNEQIKEKKFAKKMRK
ncbi:MAG: hypothetical protein US82_C0042G0006 [Parcubacteria group bacterium GW2011_GWC1_38_22]|nr:MAG: hypothetical protein US82_C0042G0006 [Parcubacteria group bacterium GW2011_GWC1_38_22]